LTALNSILDFIKIQLFEGIDENWNNLNGKVQSVDIFSDNNILLILSNKQFQDGLVNYSKNEKLDLKIRLSSIQVILSFFFFFFETFALILISKTIGYPFNPKNINQFKI